MEKASVGNKTLKREIRNCPEHGDYESASMDPHFWTPCPECQKRQEQEQARIDNEARQVQVFESMLKNAGLGKRFMDKGFDNYLPRSAAQRRILDLAREYAHNFREVLDEGRCLALIGDVGNGKTHLGVAILREVITAGHSGRYVRAYDLFKAIKESWSSLGNKRSETEAVSDFTRPDLLVLDEIGVQFNTPAERTLLFQVIDSRYNDQLPTVVISNLGKPSPEKQHDLAANDWEPRQNPKDIEDAMGPRSYDRLTENGGMVLEFHGESFRRLGHAAPRADEAWQ